MSSLQSSDEPWLCSFAQKRKSACLEPPRRQFFCFNKASKEQLLTLPGIDESRAEKIIETRPYKNKKELKKKKIVPEEVYKQISDKITATPPNK